MSWGRRKDNRPYKKGQVMHTRPTNPSGIKPQTGIKRDDILGLKVREVSVDDIVGMSGTNYFAYSTLNRGWRNLGFRDRKRILDDIKKSQKTLMNEADFEKYVSDDDIFNHNSLDRAKIVAAWRKLKIPVILY